MIETLAFLGPENHVFWGIFLGVILGGWLITAYLARRSFGLKLGLAFTTVSLALTSFSVFFYQKVTYDSLYAATTARIKDIGRTGLFLFDDEARRTILRIDRETEERSLKRDSTFLQAIAPGNSGDSLKPADLSELQNDPGFLHLVQTLRKIKNATREHVVLEENIPQAPLDPDDVPVIRYANIFVPISESPDIRYVKWIADSDFEELDGNKNGKIDEDEQSSPLGMIYNYADASEEIKGALRGEVTATRNYISDTYGVWLSAFFPIYYQGRVIAVHSMDLDARKDVNLMRKLWFESLGILGLAFLISVFISLLLSKYLTRPIKLLSIAANQIRARDFSARANLNRKDEFGNLTAAFNEMAMAVGQYAQTLERSVEERTLELRQAKQETDRILATVSDGLFLLNPDGTIRGNYSRALETIFPTEPIPGRNLLNLLASRIPDDRLKSTETYLKLLFDPSRPDIVLKGLNPLQKIAFNGSDEIWISAAFHRIKNGDQVSELLGVFSNITESAQLEQKLGNERRKSEVQTTLVLDLLRTPRLLLSTFLDDLNEYSDALERLNSDTRPGLLRLLHTLKGNAASLKLEAFAQALHHAEETITVKPELTDVMRQEYAQAIMLLRELSAESLSLVEHIREASAPASTEDFTVQAIRGVFSRRGVAVDLDVKDFHSNQIPSEYQRLVRDALVQFARNSSVHGFEEVSQRRSNGKKDTMQIRITGELHPQKIVVTYSDDGRGLDLKKIQSQAIKLGLMDTEQAMDQKTACELIFSAGFSTMELSIDAGRGIGLNSVRQSVLDANGIVTVEATQGHTAFKIELPVTSDRN
ncbi:MAG: HAMP domain-containing protein [Spirochaetia bacterium]|nr:HAMP domain-containing protein [Spirochaetia bacterium]